MRSIRKSHAADKIIIVSHRIMFLDIVHEAMKRKAKEDDLIKFTMGRFDGTIGSPDRRAAILGDFNNPNRDPLVLLCTVGAGGTGLNIAGANQLIICEPLWSPGQEAQIKGRVYRMP